MKTYLLSLMNKMEADEKMPDEFYDWLSECPVQWNRLSVEEESLVYSFNVPDTIED